MMMDEEGLSCRRDLQGYRLAANGDGDTVEYRSGENLGPFKDAFCQLFPSGREVE
jgi:hypothetical protein